MFKRGRNGILCLSFARIPTVLLIFKQIRLMGFHAADSGFQIRLDPGFLVSGTWILGFNCQLELDSVFQKPRIPNSRGKKFPGFRNPNYLTMGCFQIWNFRSLRVASSRKLNNMQLVILLVTRPCGSEMREVR